MAINVTDVKTFKFYAHKVMPLVYDESLSYYEFLCKVMQKLNEVISSNNQQNEVLEDFDREINEWELETDELFQQYKAIIDEEIEKMETAVMGMQVEASTLESGSDVTVSIELNEDGNYVISFGIPQGEKGDTGYPTEQQIATAVTTWLVANVDPVGSAVVVDSSLSVSGAAADAKTTGDAINDLKTITDELNSTVYDTQIIELYDENKITQGYIDAQGEEVSSDSWRISNYLNLSGVSQFKYSGLSSVGSSSVNSAFYDENKELLSVFKQAVGENIVDVPTGAKFARISLTYLDVENFSAEKTLVISNISYNETTITNLIDNEDTQFISGYFVDSSHTEPVPNADSYIAYIPCSNLKQLTLTYQNEHSGSLLGVIFRNSDNTDYLNTVYALNDYANEWKYKEAKTWTFPVLENASYCVITIKLGTTFDARETAIVANGDTLFKEIYGIRNEMLRDNKARELIEENITSCWSGLTWALVGDSLTEKNYRAKTSYYDYITEKTKISTINMGASGNGYARGDYFYRAMELLSGDNFDFLTIFGSGNDCNIEAYWSEPSASWETALGNVTDNGTTSICGYINRAIDKFYTLFPLKKIGIITPTPWNAYSNVNGTINGTRLDDYSNKLIEICAMRGIPCLDLYHSSGLRPWNSDFRTEYYNEDGVQDTGTHPNSKGHKWISNMFFEFLKKYLIEK